MQLVIQQHPEGCMLACAAMLSNLSYAEVNEIAGRMGMHAGDKRLYTTTEPMRRLLAELGIRVSDSELPFESWSELPDQCLLAVKWHIEDDLPHWHWVVFLRDESGPVVLDPAAYLAVHRRCDFSQMQPKWFLEVARDL